MPYLIDSDNDSDDKTEIDIPAAMVYLSTVETMKGSINFDCQSSIRIFSDKSLLTNIRQITPLLLGGINKKGAQIKANQQDEIDGITAFYNSDAHCNILSQTFLLAEGARVNYLRGQDKSL